MRHAELKTDVVDLSGLSLKELRTSADPVLLASVALLADRTEHSRPVVLQNQATKEN